MVATLERAPVSAQPSETAAIRELEKLLEQYGPLAAELVGPDNHRLRLPESVYTLLRQLVQDLARGNAVTVAPIHTRLTTQQAAELLNVSRPYVVKLLDAGEIPFERVGTHRRVLLKDVLEYRERRSKERRAFFAEMAQEAQEMGFYQ